MNHLAHLALSDGNPELLVGSFLGDFVKGRINGRFPAPIEKGIRLHRAVDRFTDNHPIVSRGRERISTDFRRYAGIMLDIAYDHLLARDWCNYYEVALEDFSRETLTALLQQKALMPDSAAGVVTSMHSRNSLARYGEPVFIDSALAHISARLSRNNPLARGRRELEPLMPALTEDLKRFYPELKEFCAEWIIAH